MGNAASLMEARHNARKDIRNERANARAGFYESASEVCGSQKTADPKEQIAYLLRLGLNRREVCVEMLFLVHIFTARFLGLTKRCVFGRRSWVY